MSSIDPILLSVFARTFKSITDEMSMSVQMTTRSPILCEAKDFVTGLYDAEGNMLEQTENLPILAFSLAPVCKYIIDYFGDDIHDGDVIFHNDVFSLGNQNNDVAVYKPIFIEGELVGWAAVKGHQADIGGNVRGGYNPNATEVWQEALRIPPVKVYEKGQLRKDVWDLIFANIRLDIVQHDMRAQMGACTVGERRMQDCLKKYGIERFASHKIALFDASRKMIEDGMFKDFKIDEVYALLGPGVALVEFLMTKKEIIAWVVHKGEVNLARIPIEEKKMRSINSAFDQIEKMKSK